MTELETRLQCEGMKFRNDLKSMKVTPTDADNPEIPKLKKVYQRLYKAELNFQNQKFNKTESKSSPNS